MVADLRGYHKLIALLDLEYINYIGTLDILGSMLPVRKIDHVCALGSSCFRIKLLLLQFT